MVVSDVLLPAGTELKVVIPRIPLEATSGERRRQESGNGNSSSVKKVPVLQPTKRARGKSVVMGLGVGIRQRKEKKRKKRKEKEERRLDRKIDDFLGRGILRLLEDKRPVGEVYRDSTSRAILREAGSAELASKVGRALGAVRLVVRRSKTLKGTYMALLKRAVATSEAAMSTLIARVAAQDRVGDSISEARRKIGDPREKLRALRVENRRLEEELRVREARTCPPVPVPVPAPTTPRRRTDAEAADRSTSAEEGPPMRPGRTRKRRRVTGRRKRRLIFPHSSSSSEDRRGDHSSGGAPCYDDNLPEEAPPAYRPPIQGVQKALDDSLANLGLSSHAEVEFRRISGEINRLLDARARLRVPRMTGAATPTQALMNVPLPAPTSPAWGAKARPGGDGGAKRGPPLAPSTGSKVGTANTTAGKKVGPANTVAGRKAASRGVPGTPRVKRPEETPPPRIPQPQEAKTEESCAKVVGRREKRRKKEKKKNSRPPPKVGPGGGARSRHGGGLNPPHSAAITVTCLQDSYREFMQEARRLISPAGHRRIPQGPPGPNRGHADRGAARCPVCAEAGRPTDHKIGGPACKPPSSRKRREVKARNEKEGEQGKGKAEEMLPTVVEGAEEGEARTPLEDPVDRTLLMEEASPAPSATREQEDAPGGEQEERDSSLVSWGLPERTSTPVPMEIVPQAQRKRRGDERKDTNRKDGTSGSSEEDQMAKVRQVQSADYPPTTLVEGETAGTPQSQSPSAHEEAQEVIATKAEAPSGETEAAQPQGVSQEEVKVDSPEEACKV
ncbi:hypothetical protein EAI_07127 [Harpegnathos saltator]|uniref:Uncharacterized protein n=1 Tax=Harpegnathos saltator TaxID=610380 RepID=E2B3Y5_HARSA|nr:hypothetical protein EAI_07127 [Harpegnathos saltator]